MFAHVLHGPTPEDLTTSAVLYLVRLGFVVEMPGRWETPAEFRRRLGISRDRFKRRLRLTKLMPQVDMERGPTGRLVRLRSNTIFDAWMRGGQG